MNKILLFVIGLIVAYFSGAAQNYDEPFKTVSLSGKQIQMAELSTVGGSLEIVGSDDGQNRLEVYVRPSNSNKKFSKEEVGERLEERYKLTTEVSGGKLIAKAEPKRNNMNWKDGLSISFKAYVPKKTKASLNTAGGSIRAEGIHAKVDGNTAGGSIRFSDLVGNANMTTSGGSIRGSNAEGILNLTTAGGSINLEDLAGTITAVTSGGSIKGTTIEGTLSASTAGGSLSFDDVMGSIDAKTSAGSARVNMRALDKYVKISVAAGSATLGLPMDKGLDLNLQGSRVNIPNLENFSGRIDKQSVKGSLHGGGIPIDVQVSSGSLTLNRN